MMISRQMRLHLCEPYVNDIRCRKYVGPTPQPSPKFGCILCNPESHEINELEVIFNGEDKTCTEVSSWLSIIPQTSDVCIQTQEFFSSFCCQARHGETTPKLLLQLRKQTLYLYQAGMAVIFALLQINS